MCKGLRSRVAVAILLFTALAGCQFDSTVDGSLIPFGHQMVILDPAPSTADCEQRSQEMMWIIHDIFSEIPPVHPGLPRERDLERHHTERKCLPIRGPFPD